MLAKKYRITENEFKRFARRAKYQRNDIFLVRYANNHQAYSQFAVVVSTKVSKLATVRNRLRRVVKAWIKEKYADIPKGYYIAIYINKIFTDTEKQTKRDILFRIFGKIEYGGAR